MNLEFDHLVYPVYEAFNLRGLPIAHDGRQYSYEITHWSHKNKVEAKSRGEGNGSVRYYEFNTVDEAMSHGIDWARRRIKSA